MSRNIDVTYSQVYKVDKRLNSTESTGAILDDADDSIETFRGSIGKPGLNKRYDVLGMFA